MTIDSSFVTNSTINSLERRKELHSGTSKVLYDGIDSETAILYFKDSLDLGCKSSRMGESALQSGALNNRLSEMFMSRLSSIGIETHFLKRLNMREQLIKLVDPLPFRVKIYNSVDDEMADCFGLPKYSLLAEPIIEFFIKTSSGKRIIASQHICAAEWSDEEEITTLLSKTKRINDFLLGQFLALEMRLVNYTIEFGRLYANDFIGDSKLVLIDAFTLDKINILDLRSNSTMISDLNIEDNLEIAKRFLLLNPGGPADLRDNINNSCIEI